MKTSAILLACVISNACDQPELRRGQGGEHVQVSVSKRIDVSEVARYVQIPEEKLISLEAGNEAWHSSGLSPEEIFDSTLVPFEGCEPKGQVPYRPSEATKIMHGAVVIGGFHRSEDRDLKPYFCSHEFANVCKANLIVRSQNPHPGCGRMQAMIEFKLREEPLYSVIIYGQPKR
jgi:hypothetical protein